MVLIHKEGKDHQQPSAYRPLSMLNADNKILATMLATRLSNVMDLCIHTDQMEFIQGRYLKNNIWRVMNVISKAQLDNFPRVLLFLDVEKAFDSIEWPYLLIISESFGIGHFLQA